MVGPERIEDWIDQLRAEQSKNGGELTVEKAKTMLALCSCIQATVTGFLTMFDLEKNCRGEKKGRRDDSATSHDRQINVPG